MTDITQDELKRLLDYDPETGMFTWRVARGTQSAGALAGCLDPNGYWRIKINRKKYQAHRLAWLYMNGYMPPIDTDHINRIRNDNRIANLREATRSENKRNSGAYKTSQTGIKGVYPSGGKFRVSKWDGSKHVHLGYFSTKEDAVASMA